MPGSLTRLDQVGRVVKPKRGQAIGIVGPCVDADPAGPLPDGLSRIVAVHDDAVGAPALFQKCRAAPQQHPRVLLVEGDCRLQTGVDEDDIAVDVVLGVLGETFLDDDVGREMMGLGETGGGWVLTARNSGSSSLETARATASRGDGRSFPFLEE